MRSFPIHGLWLPFVLLALLGSGCGQTESPRLPGETSRAEQTPTLNISQGSDVLSLDPYFILESPTFGVQINIFEPLTDIDRNLQVAPKLAVAWEKLEPTLWEFRLRSGVRFHGGEPFTAADVAFSLMRAVHWPQSRVRSEIPTVRAVRVVDDHTVRIETAAPDAILPRRLASVLILDKESSEAGIAAEGESWLATHANGTGPYRLVEWKRDQSCRLEAFEDYRGPQPTVKRLNYLATSDESTRMADFLTGKIDILTHVPVRNVERIRRMDGFEVIAKRGLRLIYLGFDVARDASPGVPGSPPNPLRDRRVRHAVYRAIDIDLVVDKVMNGFAVPAHQLFPAPVVGHVPGLQRPAYDPEQARKLLAEAGFPDGFDVRLDGPNDRYVNDAAIMSAVANQLAKVGIRVAVNARPKASFFADERAGKVSFFLLGWSNTNGDGIGAFDHLLHTYDPEKNLGGSNTSTLYSNPEVDRLTEAASGEFDPSKREELIREAVRIAMDDLPHLPLHYQMDIYAVSDRVQWEPRHDTQVRGADVEWAN